ncbi:MAG: alpha/beta hydrolase [Myxococcaceae bacterium]|nr:alpha/beta hydrolase [Myxococcaceae bacterium]
MSRRRFTELPELPPRTHDFKALERRFVTVPVAGRSKPVTLSYVQKGSGPLLLLVHGLLTSAYSWRYVISPLAASHTVVAVDLPGAGQSEAAADVTASPQSLAALLDGFVKALGHERAYVVGNSMGGYLTLWWALLHPERFERLFIIHAPGFPELRLYALRAALSLGFSRGLLAWLTRVPEQFALDNCHYHDMSLISREQTREYGAQLADDARRECFRRNLYETMSPWTMRELPAAVKAAGARVPKTKLLWSRHDVLVSPAFGPRYQALLGGAELVWLDDSSHFTQVDSPERTVEEILAFRAPLRA